MFRGGWQQMMINWTTTSAVMEASMAWFYASGVVFSVLAGAIVALEFFKLVTGKLADDQLIGIVESEEEVVAKPAAAGSPP